MGKASQPGPGEVGKVGQRNAFFSYRVVESIVPGRGGCNEWIGRHRPAIMCEAACTTTMVINLYMAGHYLPSVLVHVLDSEAAGDCIEL